MKRWFWLLLMLAFVPKLHAATCPIAAGASSSTIASTITGCGSGSTVTFAASTSYTLSTTVAIPCGVSITGPTVPLALYTTGDGYKHYGYTPTAAITWTGAAESEMFTTSGCSTAQTIQYMEFNGGRPSPDGGQILNIGYGQSNLTLQYDYFHGNQGNAGSGEYFNDPLVYFGGSTSGSPVDANNVVQWNRFGANGDCSNLMNNVSYPGYGGDGGYCVGTGVHTALNGFVYQNNVTYYQEQGLKFFESSGFVGTGTLSVFYNDFSNIHRISIEAQNNPGTMNYWYNDVHDQVMPEFGSWQFSLPAWWTSANYNNSEYNVMVGNVAPSGGSYIPGAFEFWAAGTNSYNLVQGYQVCGTQWGNGNVPSPWSINYNTYQLISGTAICNEEGRPGSDAPSQTGNTTSSTVSAQTSVAPTVSPAGGSVSSGTVVTISPGSAAINRDANTSSWCTTDGSSPVPGSGTATIMTSYTVTATVTLKCVGMWGAANQPTSYATNYGYVPSAASTYTFTVSGTPTAATPTFSPASETFTSPISVTISTTTSGATIYYTTDGSTPTTSSSVYSTALPISVTTTVKAIAAEMGYITSAVGSATYTYSSPTLTGCYQGNTDSVNTVHIANTVQQHAYCTYSSGTSPLDCSTTDANGDAVTAWGASNGNITVGAVGSGSPGLVTGIATGTANSTATVGATSCNPWTWTVTNSPPTLQSVAISLQSGGTAVTIGTPSQACANMMYTGSITTQVCGSGSDAYGTTPTGWTSSATGIGTISSSGLVTGVSAGTTNISVSAGSFTSPLLPIMVTSGVSGVNATLQGVRLTGQVQ